MNNKINVSICLDDLFAASKAGHPKVITSQKNGKKYASVDVWINNEPNQHGQHISASLYDTNTKAATYIGSGKLYDGVQVNFTQNAPPETKAQVYNQPVQPSAAFNSNDDVPF